MANRGNFVDAQSLIDDLNKAFIKHKAVIEESANALIKLEGAYGKLPSDYIRAQKEILDLQNKQIRNESQLETLQKKKIATQEAIARQQNRITKEQERYVQQLEKERQKLEASQNLYNKVQSKLNALSNEYKNLAVKKELTNKLTQDEEKRYTFLQGKIQQYDKTLKAVDATMGKYQRNVGNYASGFNPLANSINQLTREMPAFTYSVQTGFMALSNNIPIFTDAIGNAIAQNKELQAQGKPTTSVLSQLAGAFLSWQTLMGVGITLLTVYGKEIGDWLSNITKGTSAVNGLKQAQEKLNEINVQGQKNAVEETLKVKSLLAIAKDTALSYKERTVAVKELQDTYPAYFGNLEKEKILAGQTAEAEKELTDAILSRAKANAAVEKITANQSQIIDLSIEELKVKKDLQNAERALQQIRANVTSGAGQGASGVMMAQAEATRRLNQITLQKNELEKENNILTSFAIEKQKEAILLDYKEEKATKEKAKKREDLNAITVDSISLNEGFLKTLKQQKAIFEELQSTLSNSSTEYKNYQNVIDGLEQSINLIVDPAKAITQTGVNEFLDVYGKRANTATENSKELEEALQNLFKTTANNTLSSFGMDSLIPMFDGTFKKMWETANTFNEKFAVGMKYIGDVAKQTFEFINMQQQAQFDAQFQRLEQERDVALLFAGESATAREEIERQYDERRKAIQRRQAEAQKKVAIFNSIVNTAQGVTSALATANIPLAILIGILGAVQTTMIASQQIPQFYKGTDNAPEGWAYTQEKGAEIITDKSGKIKSLGSDKGAQLTYLNKGDKVYTAEQSSLMFDYGLNSLLTANGISMPKVDVNIDNSLTNAKLDEIAKAIKEKDSILVSRDRRGEELYKINNGNRQKLINTRLKIGKFDV